MNAIANTSLTTRLRLALRIVIHFFIVLVVAILTVAPPAAAASRIKDIASFEGVRDNILVGYGLVVGLNGTGDTLTNSPFTQQSLIGMLERLGINVRNSTMKTANVAAVMVTATLQPFSRTGTRIDVSVSALGDAKSLQGGTLLVTPLVGADGDVYAVSQGTISVSGFVAQGQSATVTKNVPTTARIANGAIVEREIGFELASLQSVRVSLRNPDFTTANRVAQAVNSFLGSTSAVTMDPSTIAVRVVRSIARPTSHRAGLVAEHQAFRMAHQRNIGIVPTAAVLPHRRMRDVTTASVTRWCVQRIPRVIVKAAVELRLAEAT